MKVLRHIQDFFCDTMLSHKINQTNQQKQIIINYYTYIYFQTHRYRHNKKGLPEWTIPFSIAYKCTITDVE